MNIYEEIEKAKSRSPMGILSARFSEYYGDLFKTMKCFSCGARRTLPNQWTCEREICKRSWIKTREGFAELNRFRLYEETKKKEDAKFEETHAGTIFDLHSGSGSGKKND